MSQSTAEPVGNDWFLGSGHLVEYTFNWSKYYIIKDIKDIKDNLSHESYKT